jgi:hypothetical protein
MGHGSRVSFLFLFWLYSFLPRNNLHLWIKGLNAAFVAGTAFPAFLVASRVLPTTLAALFGCFVMATPSASVARYVMPEPMYFFGFWWSLWICLRMLDRTDFLAAVAGGAAFGVLALIKPHAIALSLAFSVFLLIRRVGPRSVVAACLQLGIFYLIHAFGGLLLTDHFVWSISAGGYNAMLVSHVDIEAVMINFVGRVAALLTLLGPLILLPVAVWWRNRSTTAGECLGALIICLLAATVAMTIYFSQSVYQIAPDRELITRLHGRYYEYLLPLFALLCLNILARGDYDGLASQKWVFTCLFASPICSLAITGFYGAGPIDFPDLTLWGGRYLLPFSIGLIVVQICIAIYSIFNATPGRQIIASLAFFIMAELVTTFAFVIVAPFTLVHKAFDAAFLEPAPGGRIAAIIGRSDGALIGSAAKPEDLARALFYMRSLSIGRFAPPSDKIVDADFPSNIKWALVLPGVMPAIVENGFSVVRFP